ncbi:MAG: InlB B-repeat-containing protein [Clostridia bacterium]|nr:InlB B-repeat-containing protein [Clostridia bacterium]
MIKRYFSLICTVIIAVALTILLSGCGDEGQSIDGKNVVTFELQGGTMELKTSSVDTKINFAYHPGTYILDPVTIPGYKMFRQDYNFTGWYTSPECNSNEKWDFSTPFNTETLTLYAGWKKAIKHTFTLYYVEGGEATAIDSYEVEPGAQFDDWRGYANNRDGFTPLGYYSDAEMTTVWDSSFKHPGGETDIDVPVYVDYIVGTWELVDNFQALKSAIKSGKNVYLTTDIDCGGELLVDPALTTSYDGIFEGNGFSVSNFKVTKSGGFRPNIAIFSTIGEGTEIRNVSFLSVNYDLTELGDNVKSVKASALAITSHGAKIENVSVEGTVNTNYTEELERVSFAVYEENENDEVVNFTANITVNKQN